MASRIAYQAVIGKAIRSYRSQVNLTQEQLAEKAGLHPVYLGELERGEETASVGALIRLARALGIKLRDLVANV